MSELKLGVSPLTNVIYAGRVTKSGLWAKGKQDVTDMACNCVAQHLLVAQQELHFSYEGKDYKLLVVEKPNP